MRDITKDLFELCDLEYKEFHSKLMPNINKENIIGIRVPVLRKYAKELFKSGEYKEFLNALPHRYYEENNLHAFLIEQIRDIDEVISQTERFLPYMDNWATCDCFMPQVYKKHKHKALCAAKRWIKSDKTFAVRYGIGILMKLFLDEDYKSEYALLVAGIKSDEYYVNMMIAWYFATALAKQQSDAVKILKERRLSPWVHNRAIQKAAESRRIADETKIYLKSLKEVPK